MTYNPINRIAISKNRLFALSDALKSIWLIRAEIIEAKERKEDVEAKIALA